MQAQSPLHCVSKKFPPLNSLQLCQILTDFQNFYTAGKRIKFPAKPMRQYPPHLRHVATLPWEIKNSIFLQIFSRHCRNANILHFNRLFVVHPQILIFSVFKIASLSSYWFQTKILSCSRRFIPCWLLRDTAVTAVTNFRCYKLIAKVNK